ncbi:aldehyde dehydrogenase (NAD+) [Fusarium oxysporum f. sp. raphani 54005]|uniref:Aldehyde dehydrogenase (NAD+) n=3 Tax=Fusarium oxysporum TaxID=5507 RepID=X0C157_FUSOX|nr:aldehyde dehydrogenase (NAD+) [Fusarium oxysporum f. sp. pisi HDV247]EXK84494.1 aldehyde dehydrogenase (NAD+) [Fusarium oxysporum f. sp. raphani 54005]KAG7425433.1 putative aldehyde dehydrogenase-like protein [Fusarium oxysporum f. sp. raphani]
MNSELYQQLTAPNGVTYNQPLGLFINNEWRRSKVEELISVVSPIDENEIVKVHAGGEEDIDDAVKAARAALKGPWSHISGTGRGEMMRKLADLVDAATNELATIDIWNNGKRFSSAQGDVGELTGVLRYYAGFADKQYGQVISTTEKKFAYTTVGPIGVCGQIIPWNYPLGMAGWKIAPALAAGNCVVLKPAEQTPLSILFFADIVKKAGFPPGVINIVNGFGSTAGAALAAHMDVDKIAFTGSTATGREVVRLAASNLKEITIESGGKSPLLVFEDADLNQAVKWSHYGIMANQGQICTATSRILVHEKVYHQFIELFKERVKSCKIGNPYDSDTFQGPQVSKAQYERVLSFIESGKAEGATVALGGQPIAVNGKGFFIEPTIFTDASDDMKIYREEIFGPVAIISAFKTEDEALRRANDTIYGLGAAIFTQDITRAHLIANKIEAGMVWINSSNDSDFRIPFGGVKQSGIGRELGEEGIRAYTSRRSVHVNVGNVL